ncbi:DNA topoisomerase 2 [Xylographa vitiligo]|nr:DNA topoisomerase 2 [Xylographa vitiligo]
MIIDGKLVVSKKKKKVLVVELKQKGFKAISKTVDVSKEGESEPVVENEEDNDENVEAEANAYDYLLGMAIWSLTQERVEKLLKQIGDKELEIDALIKLSKEDLWKKDLEDFIHEWRFQLEDEERRQKKAASMGRRVSSKLKTTVKAGTRKRKNDDTPSDSDFSSKKMKKAAVVKNAVKKVQSKISMLSDSYPALKATSSTLSTITNGTKPSTGGPAVAKAIIKPDQDVWMTIDGADDSAPIAPVFTKAKEAAVIKKAAVPKVPKASKAVTKVDSDSEDEPSIRPAAPVSRAPRAAARKPVKYSVFSDSDSDNGDDMLFDVGKMVKGIGPSAESSSNTTRPLFSATASLSRPGSSAGLVARKSMARTVIESGSDDETDYTRLAPTTNGGVKTTARATLLSDEEDNSDVYNAKPTISTKSTAAAPQLAAKPRGRPPVAKAPKAVPAAKLTAKEPKKLPLSPAAKAYAAKQAKANGLAPTGAAGKAKPLAKPKYTASDDDDEDDVDKIADEMLSEDDDGDDVVLAPVRGKPAPRAAREDSVAGSVAGGRPARRAAAEAVKKTWVLDEESEDDEEEGGSEAEEEEEEEEEDTGEFDESE